MKDYSSFQRLFFVNRFTIRSQQLTENVVLDCYNIIRFTYRDCSVGKRMPCQGERAEKLDWRVEGQVEEEVNPASHLFLLLVFFLFSQARMIAADLNNIIVIVNKTLHGESYITTYREFLKLHAASSSLV